MGVVVNEIVRLCKSGLGDMFICSIFAALKQRKSDFVAQLVEQLTLNQRVQSSSLCEVTVIQLNAL
jgi:hypothetical protein